MRSLLVGLLTALSLVGCSTQHHCGTHGTTIIDCTSPAVISSATAVAPSDRPTISSVALPVLLDCLWNTPALRPSYVVLACGDGAIVAEIRWTSWTPRSGSGRGVVNVNQCEPSCASGKEKGFPASFTVGAPAVFPTHAFFTRLRVRFLGVSPGRSKDVSCNLATPAHEGGCVVQLTS